jgi:soluble lytic murein transglycosylase-like protein
MPSRLNLALMAAASSIAISFPSTIPAASARSRPQPDNAPAIFAIIENNRRVFVNDPAAVSTGPRPSPSLAPSIDYAIQQAASRHRVDPALVRSVAKVESNFNPWAVSPKGAMGVMQLMPATARRLGVTNPFDLEQNVDGGVRYLRDLLAGYAGDIDLTLAAYNAGETAVARSGGIPHFAETQDYVRRVGSLYRGGAVNTGQPRPLTGPFPNPAPIHIARDAAGVLHVSNTN